MDIEPTFIEPGNQLDLSGVKPAFVTRTTLRELMAQGGDWTVLMEAIEPRDGMADTQEE